MVEDDLEVRGESEVRILQGEAADLTRSDCMSSNPLQGEEVIVKGFVEFNSTLTLTWTVLVDDAPRTLVVLTGACGGGAGRVGVFSGSGIVGVCSGGSGSSFFGLFAVGLFVRICKEFILSTTRVNIFY